jgi:hypothetical protein
VRWGPTFSAAISSGLPSRISKNREVRWGPTFWPRIQDPFSSGLRSRASRQQSKALDPGASGRCLPPTVESSGPRCRRRLRVWLSLVFFLSSSLSLATGPLRSAPHRRLIGAVVLTIPLAFFLSVHKRNHEGINQGITASNKAKDTRFLINCTNATAIAVRRLATWGGGDHIKTCDRRWRCG